MIHNNSKKSKMRRQKYHKASQFIKNKFLFVVTVGVVIALALNICSGFTTTSTEIDVPTKPTNSIADVELSIEDTSHSYEHNTQLEPNIMSTSYSSHSETEPEMETEPIQCIELTDDEIYMLATLVYLEGRGESLECQKSIASVVINRMNLWDMTLEEVIYQKNQFSPAYLIESSAPDDTQIGLVHELMITGVSIPEYVCYFRAGYYHDGEGMNDYTCFDRTYFSYSDRDYDLWQESADNEI